MEQKKALNFFLKDLPFAWQVKSQLFPASGKLSTINTINTARLKKASKYQA
jgi:hypothetical protein